MDSFDPEQHRSESLRRWEGAASGWARRQEEMRQFGGPVSQALLDVLALKPGETVLDIAAGIGETGFLAAERVSPGGRVIVGDQAEAMVAAARERGAELGARNVEVRVMQAESVDLEVGALDAVVCRWGLMLMADPDAALREWRRVVRPGGRIALAVWGPAGSNPWATAPIAVLRERGLVQGPPAGDGKTYRPGMFALAEEEALTERIEAAGFLDVKTEPVELTRRHTSFDELWETTLDMSADFHDAVMSQPGAEIEKIHEAVREAFASFTADDGSLAIPALTIVASASA